MKKDAREFKKYVSMFRALTPLYSNGRRVVVLSEESKRGQDIIAKGSRYEGYTLNQVYDYWSDSKQQAYDDVWEMYCNGRHSNTFGICSHNTHMFTVSWLDDDGLHYVTKGTEYIVIFNE